MKTISNFINKRMMNNFKLNTFDLKNGCKNIFKIQNHRVHSDNIFDPYENTNNKKIGEVILTTKHGVNVILDPLLNKGTGFTLEERERLGIRGLIPPRVFEEKDVLNWQVKKIMGRIREENMNNIDKYTYLCSLQDRNEVLFYKCVEEYLEEIAPIIYTPTVGEACQKFAYLLRRPRGMYFSANDRGHMRSMTFNWPTDDVELIVVTDGSRILGLGDLGINGMGIPIGKLGLYTACAGIHPSKTLPIVLDVGTNNENFLSDNLYLGLKERRLVGVEYDEVLDEFIKAVTERFPKALIQFEDFSTENANRILKKYREKMLCFNDDMQGTATVTLSGILSSLKYLNRKSNPQEILKNQKIVVVGAGTAGLGVANGLLYNMMLNGLEETEARKNFWVVDDKGLIGKNRRTYFANQIPWRRDDYEDCLTLENLINEVKPTILLGLTGVGGLFTENVIRSMAKHCERPIIFPLSNPTTKAECTAENAYNWTDGKCIFASGSPFKPVVLNGKTYIPAQSNNMYTYPGIGLGALVSQSKMITDSMLNRCAISLMNCVSEEDFDEGRIFPRVRNIPKLTKTIALNIALQSQIDGVSKLNKLSEEEILDLINSRFWKPSYGSLVRIDQNRY